MIIITGASDGLGKELAALFEADGRQVVSLSRGKPDEMVSHIPIDLTSDSSIHEAARQLLGDAEPIEALIHCAGVHSVQSLDAFTQEELDRVFRTNVTGPMLLTSLLLDRLKKDKSDVVSILFTLNQRGTNKNAAYIASKWAMRGFAKTLKEEFQNLPNRVLTFFPDGMQTNFLTKVYNEIPNDASRRLQPGDVADFVRRTVDLPKSMEASEVIVSKKSL